jgi:glycosyltransferase involved in cell wall biosynthesis
MVDITITTYNRAGMLKRTLEALFSTVDVPHRIFVIDDCSNDATPEYLSKMNGDKLQFVALSKKRNGVVYGFNMLWNMVDYFDSFHEEHPYMCYLQDDMIASEKGWLTTLIQAYEELKDAHRIGFFSGHDAPEHPVQERMDWKGRQLLLKRSSGATNLIAPKTFWRSIGYVPKFNPDGTPRGFPNHQRGSHIDLYLTGCMSGSRFVRGSAGDNCSVNQGKSLMVIPGLLLHEGQSPAASTWRGKAARA